MTTLPLWDESYLPADRLRAECEAMTRAILDEIIANLGADEIISAYAHGSSTKAWDSPIDYVPELSDLDIHFYLRNPELVSGDVTRAFAIQAGYERRFAEACPKALHLPRPQIMVINEHITGANWFGPPPGASISLFGVRSEAIRPTQTPEGVRAADIASLRDPATTTFLQQLPLWAIDRPGRYLWQVLTALVWRVGPTVPRVLTVHGVEYALAWGSNRTRLVAHLEDAGEAELAEAFAGFYLAGWEFFLSGHRDGVPARAAIGHAIRVLTIGHERGMAARV